jgi:uncharacterized protein YjdB
MMVVGMQSKICKADELSYQELKFGKTYSGEVKHDEDILSDDNDYSFTLTKKTKISLDFQSLTKNEMPGKLRIYIDTDDYLDDEITNIDCFFPYKTKVTKVVTLEKGTYNLHIGSIISDNDYKYKLALNTVTSDIDNIELKTTDTDVLIGSPYQLTLINIDNTIYSSKIKWESSNTDIATVGKYGNVIAKKEGPCTITAVLPNGNKLKCDITVPEGSLERQLYSKTVYAIVGDVEDESIYNDCSICTMNNSSKDIVHIEYEIIQYNSRGQFINSPYGTYYDDDTLEADNETWGTYWVNNDARKARVCIKNVTFSDGTVWNNPLYKTWHNKYYGKKY